MAFEEKNIDALLDGAWTYVDNQEFKDLVQELRAQAQVQRLASGAPVDCRNHGYEKYPGELPHDYQSSGPVLWLCSWEEMTSTKSCMIACSSGWDTDCNSGNVGCLNGIRLGLEGFTKGTTCERQWQIGCIL